MTSTHTDIGFIGLGKMGGPMSRNVIAKAGRSVRVFDPSEKAIEACTRVGAKTASDIAALARDCDVIYVSLPTPKVVEDVLLGKEGVIRHARKGTLVIDLSTISPDVARHVAETLATKGLGYLEAPVTGGIARAADGTLTIMAGGEASTFSDAKTYLDHVCTQAIHVGPVGAASSVKLINNMLLMCNLAAAAEGMAMAAKAGLDLTKFRDIVSNGTGASVGFRVISTRALQGDFSPNFSVDLAHKDCDLAIRLQNDLGAPSLMASPAFALLKMARNQGFGELDVGALLKVYEGVTGVEARILE